METMLPQFSCFFFSVKIKWIKRVVTLKEEEGEKKSPKNDLPMQDMHNVQNILTKRKLFRTNAILAR